MNTRDLVGHTLVQLTKWGKLYYALLTSASKCRFGSEERSHLKAQHTGKND